MTGAGGAAKAPRLRSNGAAKSEPLEWTNARWPVASHTGELPPSARSLVSPLSGSRSMRSTRPEIPAPTPCANTQPAFLGRITGVLAPHWLPASYTFTGVPPTSGIL
jgi:hypothetical protein